MRKIIILQIVCFLGLLGIFFLGIREKSRLSDRITDVWLDYTNTTAGFSDKAVFEVGANGFSVIHNRGSIFYVELKQIQPYRDGFKVKFDVGNPMYATFKGLTAEIFWWFEETSKKSAKHKIGKELRPGSWTSISLIISPATREELKYIHLKLETSSAVLGK